MTLFGDRTEVETRTRRRVTGQLIFLVFVSISSLWLRRVKGESDFLWGDDALLIEATNSLGGYGSSISTSLIDSGQEKWRPIFQFVVAILRYFDLLNYNVVLPANLTLLVLVAVLCGLITYNVTSGNFLLSGLVALLVTQSRFSSYSQSAIFGLMEMLAALLCLSGVYGFVKYNNQTEIKSTKRAIFSISLIFAATLVHERYLVTLIAVIIFLLLKIDTQRVVLAFTSLCFIFINWAIKTFVLQINPLRSGASTDLSHSSGIWILKNFWYGFVGVFGGLSNEYLNFETISIPNVSLPSPMWNHALTVLIPILLSCVVSIVLCYKRNHSLSEFLTSNLFMILLVAISLQFAASLVQERVESRWLFSSELFFLIFVVSIPYIFSTKLKSRMIVWGLVFLGLLSFTVIALRANLMLTEPVVLKTQAQTVLEKLDSPTSTLKEWRLVLDIADNPFEQWMFSYGRAFEQLKNPPSDWEIGTSCSNPDSTICVYFRLTNGVATISVKQES
jgi:hypothetical protein